MTPTGSNTFYVAIAVAWSLSVTAALADRHGLRHVLAPTTDHRAFFDGLVAPYIPDGGAEGFSPIWNPEYFGNTIMVNGNTWPFQVVEQRRYRFRFLNGCQSRFLILDFAEIPGVEVWQIGNEGGFLATPVNLTATNGNRLLMGLAEALKIILDEEGLEATWARTEKLAHATREAMRAPERLTWEEAAATPLVFLVVYDMLVAQGRLKAGEHQCRQNGGAHLCGRPLSTPP